ncbi:MAG: ARMT1-like domain-containing protein [Candidatus Thermoplasmatota archaeon]|nr:ARMT1-like domain-containing protein [Candidatus Thermoplasmatota archaeon]
MKLKSRCIPCLLNRVIYEADLTGANEATKKRLVQIAARIMLEAYDRNPSSAAVATEVHRRAYRELGSEDPYRELKRRSTQVAQNLLPEAEAFIESSEDRLAAAVMCSIVGNAIDFGIAGSASSPEELAASFTGEVQKGLQHDDLAILRRHLDGEVLYFTDNCGEIVFDRLVCRELKKCGVSLTLVVKGAPVLTDATLEDARDLHFEEVVDDIATTGGFAVGVDFQQMPAALKPQLDSASLVICKGMANYESFSETDYAPVAYLLKVKCKSIAEDMGLPLNAHAVKVVE